MFVMWSFKILPRRILMFYGEEEGQDPQEGVSIILNALIPTNGDLEAAAHKLLIHKTVWNSLFYCNDALVPLSWCWRRGQVDFMIDFYQSKTKLLALEASWRLQNGF